MASVRPACAAQRIPCSAERTEGVAPRLAQRGNGKRPERRNTYFDEERRADRHRYAEAGDPLQKCRESIADDENLQKLIGCCLLNARTNDTKCASLPDNIVHKDCRTDDENNAE